MRRDQRRSLLIATAAATVLAALPVVAASPIATADVSPLAVSSYRTPNDWGLTPAGKQVDTRRTPDGVAVSPDGRTVFAVANSQLDNALTTIDASTLLATPTLTAATYFGVAADTSNVWVSGGFSNKIFQYQYVRGASLPARQISPLPGSPDRGIPVVGYPGNMVLDQAGHRLFVNGSLSVPDAAIQSFDPSASHCYGYDPSTNPDPICSVVNVVDVSNPSPSGSPHVHLVPVGRDAYGIALSAARRKLYVTNMADQTDPSRSGGAGTGTLSVIDVSTPGAEREIQVVPVGHDPLGVAVSPDGSEVAVANSRDDTISMLPVNADGTIETSNARTLSVSAYPGEPRGAMPTAVAFSPDGQLLYISLGGQNAIQVRTGAGDPIPRTVTVGGHAVQVPNSYIPAGWYPDALAVGPDPSGSAGSRLYVSNLKGLGDGPGFNELISGVRSEGSVSAVDIPSDSAGRAALLQAGSAAVVENNDWEPLLDTAIPSAETDACQPAPLPDGGHTRGDDVICQAASGRINRHRLHIVYIVKENKTFDQYFGDIKPQLPGADASPQWLLYGWPVTTNQHRLALDFTLSDRFWADSEQSTTGHSWTSAGYATPYNELFWETSGGYDDGVRGNRENGQYSGQFSGPSDSRVAAVERSMYGPGERLVDELATNSQGLSERIYSDDVDSSSPAVADRIPLSEWGLDGKLPQVGDSLDFPDTDRANLLIDGTTTSNAWDVHNGAPPPTFGKPISLSDPAKFSLDGPGGWTSQYKACIVAGGTDAGCQSSMPNYLYIGLPVDHTLGFNPMDPTPASMVADNDYAIGRIVAALSRSPFWKDTLVFITEDDTQAAGDHVDAHRTFLLTTGGLARELGPRGQASHQEGSFPSVLKTIEDMFGLRPLTIYDRGAFPLHDVVVRSLRDANNTVYTAVKPAAPFLRNPPESSAPTPAQDLELLSLKSGFGELDQGNPALERDILYAGLRGWKLPARDLRLIGR